ncbi:MAG: hypothetical protein HQL49_13390 [Gammaproteobacteria bacterium]|nr:hypothetical protein [Gammaproteobacteria bacterium]
MLTCKNITHLVSTVIEHPPTWRQRIAIQIHLWMCASCRHFVQQSQLLQRAVRSIKQRIINGEAEEIPSLPEDARQRIFNHLQHEQKRML